MTIKCLIPIDLCRHMILGGNAGWSWNIDIYTALQRQYKQILPFGFAWQNTRSGLQLSSLNHTDDKNSRSRHAHQANTRRCANAGLMLAQRHRLWPNINPILVFSGRARFHKQFVLSYKILLRLPFTRFNFVIYLKRDLAVCSNVLL